MYADNDVMFSRHAEGDLRNLRKSVGFIVLLSMGKVGALKKMLLRNMCNNLGTICNICGIYSQINSGGKCQGGHTMHQRRNHYQDTS